MTKEQGELRVVVVPDGIKKTLIDGADIAIIVGASVVNHAFGGGSILIDALIVFLGFCYLVSRSNLVKDRAFRGTADEAIAHLKSLKEK